MAKEKTLDIAALKLTFKPDGDRVLILPDHAANMTSGGIKLLETDIPRPQRGTVIVTGPQCDKYKAGDRVLYGKTAGLRLNFEVGEAAEDEDRDFYLMYQREIFGWI